MVAKKRDPKKKPTKNAAPKAPLHFRPGGMSLEEWQIALRQRAAEKTNLGITPFSAKQVFGDFEVKNPNTGYAYKVAFRGMQSDFNYCSCPDFKTNRLGTCNMK